MSDPPLTVDRLKDIAYEYYEDFYDNPRGISYFELSNQIAIKENIRVLDYVAEALDQGCIDKEKDREKKNRDELFNLIGEPQDERWDLVKD